MASNSAKSTMDVSEFRSVYESEGQYNLTVQIPYLAKLAEHYEKLGSDDPTTNWRSILQAHSLYNSCAARHRDTAEQFLQKAVTVQNMYNKAAEIPHVPYSTLQDLQTTHKDALITIRGKCREKVEALLTLIESYQEEPENLDSDHNHLVEERIFTDMKQISINCNNDMLDVAESIVSDSVQLIGPKPPCSFAAVAMGSLAREEATPYSDLEFLFVVEEKDMITESYFEHLAMTVYFLIGNLQETNLKYMDIEELEGWFVDEGKSGFKIDGLRTNAGNIPTGNGKTDENNKYICTVDRLVDRYEDILNGDKTESSSSVTGDDSDMMAYLQPIYSYGDQGCALFENLLDKLADVRPNEKRNCDMLRTTFKDMIKYGILGLSHRSCMEMEMKTEVYRYPSLLLLNMKISLQLQSDSTWETIEFLTQNELSGFLSSFPSSSFPYYISASLLIRQASYLYLDSQCERISPSKINHDKLDIKEQSAKQWHIPQKLLLVYFTSMCPSKAALICWLQKSDISTEALWYNNVGNYSRLLSAVSAKLSSADTNAVAMYAEYIPETLYSKIPNYILLLLVEIFCVLDKHETAYKLITARQTPDEMGMENLAITLEWELTLYLGKWQENKLLEDRMRKVLRQKPLDPNIAAVFKKALFHLKNRCSHFPFKIAVLDIGYPDDPSYLEDKGWLCFLNEEYEESLKFHLEHLSYLDTSMGKETASYRKSNSLSDIADLHQALGEKDYKNGRKKQAKEQYEACLKRHQQALEMESVLDNGSSQCEAMKLKNISHCHFKLNSFTLAEKFLRKSVKISIALEGELSVTVAQGYLDLYDLHMILDNIRLAELFLKKHEELTNIFLFGPLKLNPVFRTFLERIDIKTTSSNMFPSTKRRFMGEKRSDFDCY